MIAQRLGAALSIILLISALHADQIKLYTFYTPSHAVLFQDWFFPSISAFKEYDLVVRLYDQECQSASYMHAGWTKTTYHKI